MAGYQSPQAFIYQIKNLINGKSYIGSTTRTTYRRNYEHFWDLKRGKHYNDYLQNSWIKYGEEAFAFGVLEEFIFPDSYSKEYIAEYIVSREFYWVSLLKPEYNIRTGTGIGTTGYSHPPEVIEKIKKRANMPDVIENAKKQQKLMAFNRIGTHRTKEHKLRMISKELRGRRIQIYKDDILLTSCDLQMEASKLTGVSRQSISNNLIGLSKKAGGYIFKYKEV